MIARRNTWGGIVHLHEGIHQWYDLLSPIGTREMELSAHRKPEAGQRGAGCGYWKNALFRAGMTPARKSAVRRSEMNVEGDSPPKRWDQAVRRRTAGKTEPIRWPKGAGRGWQPAPAFGSAAGQGEGGEGVLFRFLYRAKPLRFLTAPMLWLCLVPIGLIDLMAVVFQFVCFPVFGVPLVRRRDYVVIDRHRLGYLSRIQRLNCAYCGYVNGVLAYVTEVAGRTEQYWCPIKHALRRRGAHGRYAHFMAYGDAGQFRRDFERVRRDFSDVATDRPGRGVFRGGSAGGGKRAESPIKGNDDHHA